jgi:CheY-like chemotaxis protein
MSPEVPPSRASILVLGTAAAAPQRAHELRLRGHSVWVASNETELSWLHGVANVRPDYALVDLNVVESDRVRVLAHLAKLASIADLPVVLIGADEEDERFFGRILAMLPCDPANTAVIAALPSPTRRTTTT